ncbi:MAG: cysteine--tRNA ligase [Rhodopseudomonas palustris]|uniref:Cysteine--tRNA ligase n=1 Tax=Rhodopseudomonas palustris TaxID=1076 RepID=A0A933VWK7_RHOPL|nr:cysteine--tRNA ligase [Rhodopseudomonas palustris]
MALRLYDTLTKEKRDFAPLDPSNVRMYVCGPTVYDFAHIGNARPVIVFDVLFRLLRHLYGENHVKYVRNITDVDDKINDRAARDYPGLPLNEAIRKVTEQTERQFHDDVDALGCLRPTVEPRATEHIAEMRTIIDRLVEGGFAYVAADHVLFSPAAMNAANGVLPRYGALANRSLDEMIAGARVDVAPYKRDATDFVLWKPSKPGEPSWPSPAGITTEGRPGWHIECSAMSWKHLGETFDIHGGGIDLVFPHHENEVAQSCCAFHTDRMAQTWMHNGFLQVEGEKMSKSLGNFVTIRELRENWNGYSWPAETLRFNMLRTHYRQPIDWTLNSLSESHNILCDWYDDLKDGSPAVAPIPNEVLEALCDDLNTSKVIAELHTLRKRKQFGELRASLTLLGFSGERAALHRTAFGQSNFRVQADLNVESLIEARTAARARKDFKESDRIRDELAAMGITIKDGKDADGKPVTTWEIAR